MFDAVSSFFTILAAFVAGIVLNVLVLFGVTDNPVLLTSPTPERSATTAPLVNPDSEIVVSNAPQEETKEKDAPLAVPNEEPLREKEESSTPVLPVASAQITPLVSATPVISEADLNTEARAALVNIFCTTKEGSVLNSITGSGVMIDRRGIILTNAHIAQFFLLKDYKYEGHTNCLIRTGAPAQPAFKAEPIYISLPWIEKNAHTLVEENPKGTGEDDFALLRITESVGSGITIPSIFAYMTPDMNESTLIAGGPILLAAYPAGFLDGATVQKDLWPASAISTIKEIFTFATDTLDLLSTGGSVVAQKGSSGGGVFSMATGKLIGIVVTSSDEGSTGDRDLRAITLSHINRSMFGDTGMDLNAFLSGDIAERQKNFQETRAVIMRQILFDVLNK